jgi:hypothetical protein
LGKTAFPDFRQKQKMDIAAAAGAQSNGWQK